MTPIREMAEIRSLSEELRLLQTLSPSQAAVEPSMSKWMMSPERQKNLAEGLVQQSVRKVLTSLSNFEPGTIQCCESQNLTSLHAWLIQRVDIKRESDQNGCYLE